jgi:predicted RNA-binding Zn-ribbon protein involved in translation (DUF1610 family)
MQNSQTIIPKQKWATFTYISKETTYITKIFKHANRKIAYHITCPDCGKAYIGQTGRTSQNDTTNTCTPSGTTATLPYLHNI